MGTVYRKTFTKPLPADAEQFTRKGKRSARWKDSKGKPRSAPLTVGKDGSDRIVVRAGTFTAKYRDGAGVVREEATGCRDETAARRVLGDLERRAELVKAGVVTAAEDATADHQGTPLAEHVAAFIDHQTAKGLNRIRIDNTRSRLGRLSAECGFQRLGDLSAAGLERWLAARQTEGMGAGNRNEYRQELVGFGNWCVRTCRLTSNPFAGVPKADAKADCRRKRRALTEDELTRLLDGARRRPLLDAMTIRQGKNKGKAIAKVSESNRARLKGIGRERALLYKTLVLTGLRKSELASLTVGQLEFDGPVVYVVLEAADEKSRRGADIPLRDDLAADLRQWLADKLEALQGEARRRGEPIPARLPADTPVFYVPTGLVRILNRDLRLAGIPKRDERGRTVDVHAMRHTFGTHLSKGGVAPRTAQAAMRHSSIDLTMNIYTDPKLLDVHGALDVLPELPLGGDQQERQRATGTTGVSALAPLLAPKVDKSSKSRSTGDIRQTLPPNLAERRSDDVSGCGDKRNSPLTKAVNGLQQVERRRIELPTSALRTQRSPN